jgi:hypothetical protein
LYQLAHGGGSVARVMGQFTDHRLSETADTELFEKLVVGTVDSTPLLDEKISPKLMSPLLSIAGQQNTR